MSHIKQSILLILVAHVVGCAALDADSTYENGQPLKIHVDHRSTIQPDPHFAIPAGSTKPFVSSSIKPPTVSMTQ